jgi:branched-chain amino acid aminotransferase
MSIPVFSADEYRNTMLSLPRPGADEILAFYEHRIGGICKDARLMLLPLDDHMAHRGDGVFETIKYSDGYLYQLDPHLARLQRSAAGLFIEPPCSWEQIRAIVIAVAAAGGEPLGQMRVLIGRGPGGFGIDPAECPTASLYVIAYRFHTKPESWFAKGLKGYRTSIPAKQHYIAKLKTTNYIPNALMIREGKARGMDIPFCFDDNGCLAESSVANLCIVDASGSLAVPELDQALSGTTLLRGMELLKGTLPIEVRRIREEEIHTAREVILFGTGPDCVAITSYEDRMIASGKPGPVSIRARKLIGEDIPRTGVPIPGLGEK